MTDLFRTRPASRQSVLRGLAARRRNDLDLRHERAFLYLFHPGDAVLQLAREVQAAFSLTDRLAPKAFPSLARLQADLVETVAALDQAPPTVAGSVTSGGTESSLLAMKSARDRARGRSGTSRAVPEVVAPLSVHPCFLKAAHYLGLRLVTVPLRDDYRVDPAAVQKAIGRRTVMLIGSAPSFGQGMIDPIPELAELAVRHGLWLHVDACMGGMIAPFVRALGRPVPAYDLSIPGVASLAIDLHKYGFAPKAVSVLLYRDQDLIAHQPFVLEEAFGMGRYATPTLTASQPGAPVAAAWATLRHLGRPGFRAIARRSLQAFDTIRRAVAAEDALVVRGAPVLPIFSFGARSVDIMRVADGLEARRWHVTRVTTPPSIHLRLTPAHQPVAAQFVADLTAATAAAGRARGRRRRPAASTYSA